MPRKGTGSKKTASGAPAGPPIAPPGQTYGEGERQIESQRRMPVPSGPPPAPGANTPGPMVNPNGATPAQQPLQQRMERAMQAVQAMNPGRSLYAPTQRPSEPITTGMAIGAGAGPEALRTGDRVARTLRLLADVSGDARFSELADVAARQGQ